MKILAIAVLAGAAPLVLAAEKTYTFGVSGQRTNVTFQSDSREPALILLPVGKSQGENPLQVQTEGPTN